MREKYGPAPPPEVPEEELPDPLPTHETACLQGHDGPILAVRFNRTGTYCLTCGKVCYASAASWQHGVQCLQSLNGLQDRTLRLWNPHRGVHIKTYVGHGYDVRDVCVSAANDK